MREPGGRHGGAGIPSSDSPLLGSGNGFSGLIRAAEERPEQVAGVARAQAPDRSALVPGLEAPAGHRGPGVLPFEAVGAGAGLDEEEGFGVGPQDEREQ